MGRIVRAEIVIHDVETCPVANAAKRAHSSVTGVARTTIGDTVVEEFSVVDDGSVEETANGPAVEDADGSVEDADGSVEDADGSVEDADGSVEDADGPVEDADGPVEDADGSVEEVFSTRGETVYRFEHSKLDDCICETIEEHGVPVRETTFENGDLVAVFHATVETVGDVVDDLSEIGVDVSVQRLVTPEGESGGDLVLVDRSELTDRQLEVLETAHRMGYFDPSGGANASDVAEEFDLALSTVTQHLSAAQGKLLDAVIASSNSE
ncbi:helix-turn-helix domain-containing protein [Halorubrum luteum]